MTSGPPFDERRYIDEVLIQAREGKLQLKDPFVRYGCADGLPDDDDEFDDRVSKVRGCWEKLKEETEWKDLVGPLRADHDHWAEEGRLTRSRFSALRQEEESKALGWLESRIAEESTTHCTAGFAAMLVRENGFADAPRVVGALSRAEITVVDRLADLPREVPADYRDLRNAVKALRLGLSAELILRSDPAWPGGYLIIDGFRLRKTDGRLTKENLRLAREVSHEKSRDHAGTDCRKTIVSALELALDEGKLDELLFWEVVQPLRELARELGKTGALHQSVLAARAGQSGLDPDEAGRVALAVVVEYQERVKPAAPPDPPASARAEVGPDRVRLSWQPSSDVTVPVVYRVVRNIGDRAGHWSDGEVIAEETRVTWAQDRHPPAGEELRYAVFAGSEVRAGAGGLNWSGPASAPAVCVAPEISSLSLKAAGQDAVSGSWTTPAQADESLVLRVTEGGEVAIESGRDGFLDTGLTPGAQYRYLITARYQARDGTWRDSAVTAGTIQLAPAPVEPLSLEPAAGLVRVTWVPPPAGQVSWYLSEVPPLWPPGSEIGQDGLAALGEPVAGTYPSQTYPSQTYPSEEGQLTAEFAPPPGRHFLFAVTTAGARSVIGATRRLGRVEPATGLIARRLAGRPGEPDQALLGWVWPDGAASSIVTWPDGTRRYSRHGYYAEGGAAIPVGLDEVTIEVAALHSDAEGDWPAEPARVTLPGRPDNDLMPGDYHAPAGAVQRRGIGLAELQLGLAELRIRRKNNYRIVVAGGPGTGKTVLVTVLGHELMNRLGARFGLAIEAADDYTQRRFSDGYEYSLYREFKLPDETPAIGAEGSRPLPFTLTTVAPPLAGVRRSRQTKLTLADIGGADLASDASFTAAVRELGEVDAVVLVTDLRSPAAGAELAGQLERVDRVFGWRASSRPLLAVVVTKIDLLTEELPLTSALRAVPDSGEPGARAVQAEVATLLASHGPAGFELVASRFRRFRYFGVSALGEAPGPDGKVSPRGIRPYRADEPFRWLLAGFGVIPAAAE